MDLCPNRAIREKHLAHVRGVHEQRLAKIKKGHGVTGCHLEKKFLVARTGAKTFELRRERAGKIALDNRLLVGRMKRILTHSVPVWADAGALGAGSAIMVDHLSVLRPTSKKGTTKKVTSDRPETTNNKETLESSGMLDGVDIDLGMSATMTTNEFNEQVSQAKGEATSP